MILAPFAVLLLASAVSAADVSSARARADARFLAGFDHFRAGRLEDARREWNGCRELDETHDFCEFGLSVLDAGPSKGVSAVEPPVTEAAPGAAPEPAPIEPGSQDAMQQYLDGVLYYQKGDYAKAGEAWRKAKELAVAGCAVAKDATAGLEKLDTLGVKLDAEKPPKNLKDGPEQRDEHEALQSYFTGLIHYQKSDLEKARVEWTRALAQSPKDSSVESDSKAALEKLDKEEASTRRDGKK